MILMLTDVKRKKSLDEIAKRAAFRMANPNLRHVPNENDLRVASEHTMIMLHPQCQTVKAIEGHNLSEGEINMATTTFEKTIYLDQAAAERLAEILEKPAPPRPKINETFWEDNDRKVNQWLSRLERQSQTQN